MPPAVDHSTLLRKSIQDYRSLNSLRLLQSDTERIRLAQSLNHRQPPAAFMSGRALYQPGKDRANPLPETTRIPSPTNRNHLARYPPSQKKLETQTKTRATEQQNLKETQCHKRLIEPMPAQSIFGASAQKNNAGSQKKGRTREGRMHLLFSLIPFAFPPFPSSPALIRPC